MQNVILSPISISEIRNLLKEVVEQALLEQFKQRQDQTNQKTIFNFIEGCQYIGISKSHGYKLTSGGLIPFSKRGKRIYFDKGELDKWLLENKVKGVAELEAETNDYLTKKRGEL
ncbi:MAG: helix-turn-helix domain-containing protein [Chitinophagales bacterium]